MLLCMVSSRKFCMDAASILFHFSLFHLLILVVSLKSDGPKSFQCGNLGEFSFPVANYRKPDHGLVKIDCDSRPYPELCLQNEWLSPLKIVKKLSSNRLRIRNLYMRDFLIGGNQSRRCEGLDSYNSLPKTPSISFSIFPNITLFKCGKSVNLPQRKRYRNYNGCEYFNVYYGIPNDATLPSSCSKIILPSNGTSNSDDLFELLVYEHEIEWVMSDKCNNCQLRRGVCTTNSENEFHCSKGRSIPTVISIAGVSFTGVFFFAIVLFVIVNIHMQNRRNNNFILERYGNVAQKRYKYSDLKKITNSFDDKLGEGGFASVYRGKLPEGRDVAVKILKESKGNGDEFINEMSSISRTSHVNVVSLLGFCVEGSKRALIYEFMPNGSLEKFVCTNSSLAKLQLGWEKLFQIAVGIARGIEYLHQGCNTRILHFDIKPHNILLDEDFNPKISDFGLSKLCTNRSSIVSILGTRGTIGYIAPELVCRNFGEVSHKSDVYSYGMMVLEIVGERKNIDIEVDRTSDIYFPNWIYKHLEQNAELNFNRVSNEDEQLIVRKMIIVGLWCIQSDPTIRPPMTKVLEMLEGNTESLQIPPKPYLSSPPGQEGQEQTSSTSESPLITSLVSES